MDHVRLDYDGPVADRELRPAREAQRGQRRDGRAALRAPGRAAQTRQAFAPSSGAARGKSFSSGRDTSRARRPHRGHHATSSSSSAATAARSQFFTLPCPILVALKGWVIGGSFERALLCDMRVAGESARMRLPGGAARRGAGFGRHRAAVPDGGPRPRRPIWRSPAACSTPHEALAPRRRLARRARRRARRRRCLEIAHAIAKAPGLHGEDVPAHAPRAWRIPLVAALDRRRRR